MNTTQTTTLLGVAEALFSFPTLKPCEVLEAAYIKSSLEDARRWHYADKWTEEHAKSAFSECYGQAIEQANGKNIEQLLRWLESYSKLNDEEHNAMPYARRAVAYENLKDYILANFSALQSELAKTLTHKSRLGKRRRAAPVSTQQATRKWRRWRAG